MPRSTEPSRCDDLLNGQNAENLRLELVRLLTRRSGDRVLAEDLAQEALVHVLGGLPRFRGAAALRTWARRIALNVWRDYHRRRVLNPTARAAAGDGFSVSALLDSLSPAEPTLSPPDAYDRHATHNCLLDAARQLPLVERGILLLHDFGNVPLGQAAEELGCSVGTARVRLHRARRHLAEICRGECIDEAGPEGAILCTPRDAPISSRRKEEVRKLPRKRRR